MLPFVARIAIPIVLIVLGPLMTYFLLMGWPASSAKTRARKIDARISSAMAFISAMASADVNVDVIFKELARQPIYGEIRNEASWITRDTELLGVDILTAIRKAAQRSPSPKFQDFLQGVVTTSTSGGQLKPYFLIKADQYEKEAKLELRKKIETLGMLAETFVTVVVAFPLFLVVILAIMVLVQANPDFMLNILYAVVGLMIPLAQFGFVFVIWNMSQEA
jgi:flagellar protein FlaJ